MLLLSALEISFAWAVIALALIGIGSLVLARFAKEYSLVDAFWMGLAASVALLGIWNLLLPITSSTTILLLCAGLLGLVANRCILYHRVQTTQQLSPRLILLAFAIVLFIALRSAGPCDYGDTGLYGASAVRWIQTYPVVPGLANLHGRLGFNSSVFLVVAVLQQGVWRDLGFHLFTGFMLAALCLTILPACARVAARFSPSPADWFHAILAIPVIVWITRSKIVGTLTDEPAAIACLVAAGILCENFSQTNEESQLSSSAPRLIVAATLFSLAVSFKLSTSVFGLLAWGLAFRKIWLLSHSAPKRTTYLAAVLALSTLILLPWCARGVILSGYPFFPAAVFGFPVDWKLPLSAAKWYSTAIQSWGRNPDATIQDTRGLDWLREWLPDALRNRTSFQIPLGISVTGLVVVLAFRVRSKLCPVYRSLWLLLPSLAGTIFWFWASPDLRFGQFAIWTTAATLGSWGIVSATSGGRAVYARTAVALLLVSLVWCLVSFGWQEPYRPLLAVKELPPYPKPGLVVFHTLSGLAIYVPAQGGNCWDALLPCTPYPDETLRLRTPPSMRAGFASAASAEALQKFWPVITR